MTPEQEDALWDKCTEQEKECGIERWRLAIRAAYAQGAAQESQWREAVLNELIVAHIYTKEHDTNPRKAIQDAITWNCQVALDPAVSSDARKLIAQERERCAYICDRWSGVGDVVARAIAAAIRSG